MTLGEILVAVGAWVLMTGGTLLVMVVLGILLRPLTARWERRP